MSLDLMSSDFDPMELWFSDGNGNYSASRGIDDAFFARCVSELNNSTLEMFNGNNVYNNFSSETPETACRKISIFKETSSKVLDEETQMALLFVYG